MRGIIITALLLIVPPSALASSTRTIDADALISSGHTSTVTLPSATGTAMISAGITQEVPSGTCNGSTTSFTLAHTPVSVTTVALHLDGMLLTQGSGNDYTISGSSITLTTACSTGQTLYAEYSQY